MQKGNSMTKYITYLLLFIFCSLLSCTGNTHSNETYSGGDTITSKAELLTITHFKTYTIVDIKNPWSKNDLLQRYILIDNNKHPDNIPDGTIIKTPLKSSLVYSSVHAGAIKELGAINTITAICDAQYYKIPEILNGLESGYISDVGSSMSPSIEQILELSPDAILTSPFQNAGHGAIEQLGIPIIECADYMESSPLGRAEWIKLFGELYGKQDIACAIFDAVSENYNNLKDSVSTINHRPIVISEMVTDGVWFLPGGNSYMAKIFHDAGADYPWKEDKSTGSIQLDFATVYDRAHNADYWFIKTFNQDLTLDELQSIYSLHSRLNAFSNGGVYACNTATTTFFEDFPFHPDLLLRDFINIIHPNTLSDSTTKYYKQVK